MLYILLFSAMVFLTACVKEDGLAVRNDEVAVHPDYFILADVSYRTKVSYSSDGVSSYFQEGEKVGVFALDADKKPLSGKKENACYTVHVEDKIDLRTNEYLRTLRYLTDGDNLGILAGSRCGWPFWASPIRASPLCYHTLPIFILISSEERLLYCSC